MFQDLLLQKKKKNREQKLSKTLTFYFFPGLHDWTIKYTELRIKKILQNVTSIYYILRMTVGFAQSQRSAEALLTLPNLLYNLDFCSLFPLEFHKEWVGNEHVFKNRQ